MSSPRVMIRQPGRPARVYKVSEAVCNILETWFAWADKYNCLSFVSRDHALERRLAARTNKTRDLLRGLRRRRKHESHPIS